MKDAIQNGGGDLVFVPVDALRLSPLNPRQAVTDEEISDIVDSIIACGLIQNLSGLACKDGGTIEIVAGGRRLRALQRLSVQGYVPVPGSGLDLNRIPVKITSDPDLAAQWAMGENVARKDPSVADEVEAYAALAARGVPLSQVARAFAVTEIHVKRRLKLAGLPACAMQALRAEKIGYGQAAVLTLCTGEEEVSELLALTLERGWSEGDMRRHIARERVSASSPIAKYVGLDAYEAAGGGVTRDLFTDYAALEDAALIDRLYREMLCAEAAKIRTERGFAWAEAVFEGYVPYSLTQKMTRIWPQQAFTHNEAEAMEYADLAARSDDDGGLDDEVEQQRLEELLDMTEKKFTPAQLSVSGCFVYVGHRGEVCVEGGYVAPEDYDNAAEVGVVHARVSAPAASGEAKPADEPTLSAAVIADLKAIRLAAVQSALLNMPDLLTDLLAYALSPHAPRHSNVFDIRLGKPSIIPSVDEAFSLDDRLRQDDGRGGDLAAGFADFRKLPKAKRQAALLEAVARALNYGCGAPHNPSPLFDQIEAEADAGMRRVWRPTKENFFGRVTSQYLDEIYCSVFALDDSSAPAKAFAALKKSEKAVKLSRLFDPSHPDSQGYFLMTPEAAARIAAWMPEQF